MSRLNRAKGQGFPRVVIQTPIPLGVPLPFIYVVNIPGKVSIGPLRLGLSVQFGGGSTSHNGQVLGFAIQHNSNDQSIKQILRQDYGDWHQIQFQGNKAHKEIQWQDTQGLYNFHYHIPRKLS
jgi:hypothetical protein